MDQWLCDAAAEAHASPLSQCDHECFGRRILSVSRAATARSVLTSRNEALDLGAVSDAPKDLERSRVAQAKDRSMIAAVIMGSADYQHAAGPKAATKVIDHDAQRLLAKVAAIQNVRGADHVEPVPERSGVKQIVLDEGERMLIAKAWTDQ